MTSFFENLIQWITGHFDSFAFLGSSSCVCGMMVILLVGLVCGGVGAMVVGNRMAFFSDALAHCAFAGVALAFLIGISFGARGEDFQDWVIVIMVCFGVVVGLLIAFVRERTSLASDTVIGVFFAGSIGLGAMMTKAVGGRGFIRNLDFFLFGDPLTTEPRHIVMMLGLLAITAIFLMCFYNFLVFTSFNESLARSRQIPTRLSQYLFVALLGVLINLCLQIVGTLLVNALLIVPAAAASNLARNMRQLFWLSIFLCIGVGIGGEILAWEITIRSNLEVGTGGTIVVLSVMVFILSFVVRPWVQKRNTSAVILSNTNK